MATIIPEDTHHRVFRQGKNTYARELGLKGGIFLRTYSISQEVLLY